MTLSRRALLLGALPLAVATAPKPPRWLAALQARTDQGGLLRSYDVAGLSAFDLAHENCAYVYDNAVAGCALLAVGDVGRARAIGDTLVRAQTQDRFWRDGRLRNAYASGPTDGAGPVKLPGWWDAGAKRWLEDGYQAGTATGVVAWAMLFWLRLAQATAEARYREAAARAGDWVERQMRGARGYFGGMIGFEPQPVRLTWVSTEHNLDLAVAFAALGRDEAASHARDFVASMWLAPEARFASGLRPDGSINGHSAVDANLWPLLAPSARPEWRAALDWVLRQHGLPANGPRDEMRGVDFDRDRDGIWLEGTAIAALTSGDLGNTAMQARLLATVEAQTAPSGLVYACTGASLTTGLSTGLDMQAPDFLYYRRPHIAPTAWAVLASLPANPFLL